LFFSGLLLFPLRWRNHKSSSSDFSAVSAVSKMQLPPTKPLFQQLRENRLVTGFDQLVIELSAFCSYM
jgi:hypothetical protein